MSKGKRKDVPLLKSGLHSGIKLSKDEALAFLTAKLIENGKVVSPPPSDVEEEDEVDELLAEFGM